MYSLIASALNTTNGVHAIDTDAVDSTGAQRGVLGLVWGSSSTPPTVTDSKGNTWTQFGSTQTNGSVWFGMFVSGVGKYTGSGHTVHAAKVSGYCSACVAFFADGPLLTFGDNVVGAANNASSIQPGSLTPTIAPALIVCVEGRNLAGTMSIDSGFTIAQQKNYVGGACFGSSLSYLVQDPTASAVNPTITEPGATPCGAIQAAFYIYPLASQYPGVFHDTMNTDMENWGARGTTLNMSRNGVGPYHIAGTTLSAGDPVQRIVYLFEHGVPRGYEFALASQISDPVTGAFDFRNLGPGKYTCVSVDPSGNEDNVTHADVTAVLM